MSVPCEEAFVPEGSPVMPLYAASQAALVEFGDRKLESIPNINVPFSSLELTAAPRERNEYITLDRLSNMVVQQFVVHAQNLEVH